VGAGAPSTEHMGWIRVVHGPRRRQDPQQPGDQANPGDPDEDQQDLQLQALERKCRGEGPQRLPGDGHPTGGDGGDPAGPLRHHHRPRGQEGHNNEEHHLRQPGPLPPPRKHRLCQDADA